MGCKGYCHAKKESQSMLGLLFFNEQKEKKEKLLLSCRIKNVSVPPTSSKYAEVMKDRWKPHLILTRIFIWKHGLENSSTLHIRYFAPRGEALFFYTFMSFSKLGGKWCSNWFLGRSEFTTQTSDTYSSLNFSVQSQAGHCKLDPIGVCVFMHVLPITFLFLYELRAVV